MDGLSREQHSMEQLAWHAWIRHIPVSNNLHSESTSLHYLVALIIFHIHASETAYTQMKAFVFFIIYTVLSMHKYLH